MTDSVHLEHLGACRTAFWDLPEACGKILLVGEDNPISAEPEHALFPSPAGCSGHRLQEIIFGLPRVQHLGMWRTNLCVGGWSVSKARERATLLTGQKVPWSVVVMLGRKVASAFSRVTLGEMQPFQQRVIDAPLDAFIEDRFTLISLPHPSGRNAALWNVAAISRAQEIMRSVAPGIDWGSL